MFDDASIDAGRRVLLIEYLEAGDQIAAFGIASNDPTVGAPRRTTSFTTEAMHHGTRPIHSDRVFMQPATRSCRHATF